jgi:hypothetical protein
VQSSFFDDGRDERIRPSHGGDAKYVPLQDGSIGVTFSRQQGAFPVGRVAVFRKMMIVEAEYY